MNRMALILVLVAAAAIGTLTILGGAQADPPQSGNWTITMFEFYSGPKQLVVNGSVFIEDGASLNLYDVDVVINATIMPQLTMAPGAQLIMTGGTVDSIGLPVVINLEHGSIINGVKFTSIESINIWDWGASVRNCTILDPMGVGIYYQPKGDKMMPTTIADNTISGSGGDGIFVDIFSAPPEPMLLTVSGNTVTGSSKEGIKVIVDGVTSGRIYMDRNRVERAGGNGLFAELTMRDLRLDVDGTYIQGCLNYGLALYIDVPGYGNDTIRNVTVLECNTFGVALQAGPRFWDRPTLRGFDVRDNFVGGFLLNRIRNATIVDSRVLNPVAFKGEFWVIDSQLDIYRTEHTLASASLTGGSEERVTSWRYVDLTYTWQNGVPIVNASYEVLDQKDLRIYSGTTDMSGWLGNVTVWDWTMDAMMTEITSEIHPILSNAPPYLWGPTINLDRDIKATIEFTDDGLPDLSFSFPPDGHVQNTTDLTVNGTCTDALSGLKVLMVAFESTTGDRSPWYTWDRSGPWEVALTGLYEGANRIIVRAYDVANYPDGAFAELTRSVTVDTVRPWLRVVRPVPVGATPLVTNQDQMPFELEFDSDVVTVVVNGAPSAVTLLGRFSGIITLTPGDNLVTWAVIDLAGNSNATRMRFVLDVTPPSLTVTLPDGTFYTPSGRLTLGGTTDKVDASVLVNGAEAAVVDGYWTFMIDLVEGANILSIRGVDAAGNSATLSRTVVLDTIAPVVTILEPAAGTLTNRVPISVRGTVDSPLLDGVVAINGVLATVLGGEFVATVPVTSDGTLVIAVVGRDLAGNDGQAEVTVVVDTTPPTVTGLSIADGRLTNDPHLLLSGIVEAGCTLSIGGALVEYVGGSFAFELDLIEGLNRVGIESRDASGNGWSAAINITLDTIAPQLVVDRSVDGSITFRGSVLALTGRTEPGATLVIAVGNASTPIVVDAMGEFSHMLTLVSGRTQLRIRAQDAAGNSATTDIVAERTVPAPAPEWTGSPAVRAAAAAGTVLVVLGVAASMEASRYALLVLILPLYARIHKHEVLDNKTRYALHGLILENPGLHYNEIIREFGLTNGVAAYHLHVLEREGFLRAVRDGTLKRFYSVTTKVPQDRRLTPDQIRDSIVRLVAGRPGINQREIVTELGIGRTVAGYHLKAMVDEGTLESSRFGKFTTYKVKPGRRLL